jgi:hypothetical protein
MMRAHVWRSGAVFAIVVVAATAVAFGANAVFRPGCSLLPVTLPSEDNVAQLATPEQVCAVLGRPLPHAATLPRGAVARVAMDGPPPFGFACCRMVHVSYAMHGRNFARLTVHRQAAIPVGNVGQINATLAGAPAIIEQRRLPTTEDDDVSYLWARDGLLLGLHVRLADGITREAADAMAASIR